MMVIHNRLVEFEIGKQRLETRIFEPEGEGPFPGVLFYQGRASSIEDYIPIAQTLAQSGIVALTFNFSSDQFAQRFEEAKGAYLLLSFRKRVDRGHLGICGVSMGAYEAVLVASYNPVSSLLLRTPAAYPQSEKSVAFKLISKFEGDLLIVESENDQVKSFDIPKLYFDHAVKARRKERLILKSDEGLIGQAESLKKEEFKQIAADWFTQTLR